MDTRPEDTFSDARHGYSANLKGKKWSDEEHGCRTREKFR